MRNDSSEISRRKVKNFDWKLGKLPKCTNSFTSDVFDYDWYQNASQYRKRVDYG